MQHLKRWLSKVAPRYVRTALASAFQRGGAPPSRNVMIERRRRLEGDAESILESISDGFFAMSRDWRFIYVNRPAGSLLGRAPADLFGKVIWEEFPGLVGTEFEKAYRRVAALRVVELVTAFYPDHDRWYEVRVSPAPYGISIYLSDVSERKRSEAEIDRLAAESDRQRRVFETALSNTTDFNYVFDLQGRFTYINKALLGLWGKQLVDAVGKNFFDLDYPAELAERLQRQIMQVVATGQTLRDETVYTSALGTRAYEYIFTPVSDASGSVVAVSGASRDITERLAAEAELRETVRRKDEFLAILAHELRNPLAPLSNGLQIIRLAGADRESVDQAQQMMGRQLAHLVRLVDDLMDLSRVSRGQVELRRERVQIGAVLRQAVETVRPLVDQASHRLTVSVPASPIFVDADPTRLAQVFTNLLNNAVKFTDPGGSISLVAQRDGSDVTVRVTDDGIGIPVDMQPRVFEMFTKAHPAMERSRSGLGIGLALMKGLVEMHSGSVEVRSEGRGLGSEFTVRLPIALAAVETRPDAGDGVSADRSRCRIVIVDDNRDAATSMAQLLGIVGHETRVAYDGLEALALAPVFQPDLILMDIGMPGLNGYDTARRIREESWGKDVALVALTGWGNDHERQQSSEAGFDHHLVKPGDLADILKLVDFAVVKRRSRTQDWVGDAAASAS